MLESLETRRLMSAGDGTVPIWTATIDPQDGTVVVASSGNSAATVPYQLFRSENGTAFDPLTAVLIGTSTGDPAVVDASMPSSTAAGIAYGIVPIDTSFMGPFVPTAIGVTATAELGPIIPGPIEIGTGGLLPITFVPPTLMDPANLPTATSTVTGGQRVVTITVPPGGFPAGATPTLQGGVDRPAAGGPAAPVTVAPPPPAACPPTQIQLAGPPTANAAGVWTVTVTVGTALTASGDTLTITVGSAIGSLPGGYTGSVVVQGN